MRLTIGWMQLALALGALQGLLLASVLLRRPAQRTANRLLAALMLAFSVYLVGDVYYAAGLVRDFPHLFGISYPLPWLFGPLVYLYTVAASDSSRQFRPRDALHFAPVMIVVVATLPIYLMSGADKIALLERLEAGDVPAVLTVLEPWKYVSGLAYSVLTVRHLLRHRRRVENSYSNTERVNLSWLLRLAGAAAAIWLLAVAIGIADLLPQSIQRPSDDLVGLAIAILVYAIGYMGLRQPEVHRYDGPAPEPPAGAAPAPRDRGEARYERSGLTDAEAAALEAELLALMAREHPYRDPDLTLADLADRLSTTPHKLSEVLNSELAQTFYDFVNSYRVEEVRRRLADAKSKRQNVLALAMDAGFASKSTFNQVFKKRTGQTPSSYRKALAG
ncbi:MAG TPA: helix-turn-helix transcriptional regulator [Gemmatimonadaceae bacterium]|nr:helix-turn-helix transcriptional regulator [Gemmatimonadaceae bacterium]